MHSTVAPRWLRGAAARGVMALAATAVSLPIVLTLAERFDFAPLAMLDPLLHPKDRANLPIVRGIIDTHFIAVLLGLGTALAALLAAMSALRRGRWWTFFTANAALVTALWVLVFGVFKPALARQRTLEPFLAEADARVAGRPLAFYPGTFDWAAVFYSARGVDYWPGRQDAPGPHYVLVWHDDLVRLAGEHAGSFTVLATSTGTNPKGRRHLSLVELR